MEKNDAFTIYEITCSELIYEFPGQQSTFIQSDMCLSLNIGRHQRQACKHY